MADSEVAEAAGLTLMNSAGEEEVVLLVDEVARLGTIKDHLGNSHSKTDEVGYLGHMLDANIISVTFRYHVYLLFYRYFRAFFDLAYKRPHFKPKL